MTQAHFLYGLVYKYISFKSEREKKKKKKGIIQGLWLLEGRDNQTVKETQERQGASSSLKCALRMIP